MYLDVFGGWKMLRMSENAWLYGFSLGIGFHWLMRRVDGWLVAKLCDIVTCAMAKSCLGSKVKTSSIPGPRLGRAEAFQPFGAENQTATIVVAGRVAAETR